MSKPTILVTGKNGQLGNELQVLSKQYSQFEFIFTDSIELDIADAANVEAFCQQHRPSVCINAAAYTAVDKAETERKQTLAINAHGVGNLAASCAKINSRFIHVSTDYVFDGMAIAPYPEDHPTSPVNFYGESKLKGEEMALENLPSAIIVRTSWVYSFYGNNFVKTMLRLMKDRESLNVINDQFGSPTYAADLAACLMQLATMDKVEGGIYHFSNQGAISWYDFALAIRDLAGLNCKVNPIDTSGYPTPAKRPAYSVMNKEKIEKLGIVLKDWKRSLQECMKLLSER